MDRREGRLAGQDRSGADDASWGRRPYEHFVRATCNNMCFIDAVKASIASAFEGVVKPSDSVVSTVGRSGAATTAARRAQKTPNSQRAATGTRKTVVFLAPGGVDEALDLAPGASPRQLRMEQVC